MQSVSPWYKEVWAWVLILIPFSAVVMGFVMADLSISTRDSLVVDDYYKEGKAINLQLEKIHQAKALHIAGYLHISAGKVDLELDDEAQHDGSALTLNFFHKTLQERDFQVQLTRTANNHYIADLPHSTDGKWRLTLSPYNDRWKVKQEVTLPRADKFRFSPE